MGSGMGASPVSATESEACTEPIRFRHLTWRRTRLHTLFLIRASRKKFKKSSMLIIFTFDFGLKLSALRILAHSYRYLRLFYFVYRDISY